MAEKAAGAVAETPKKQPGKPKKYTVEKLGKHCRELFGVSSSTYAGATYGMTGEYSVEEMKTHIEKWGKKEVK